MIEQTEMKSDIEWTLQYLSKICPRSEKLVIKDDFLEDESHWFRAAIENHVVTVRNCVPTCPRLKKRMESGPDEFVANNGNGSIRHLFSLTTPPNPTSFNREYLPHIAAYARLILGFGYDIHKSSFSFYRSFTKDLLYKKKGGSYETDAEFYDSNGKLYLHVEVKSTPSETEKLVEGLNRTGSLSGIGAQHAKELEYVLDLRPTYLWVVGPGSVEPEKYVYKVSVDGLNANFELTEGLPEAPY
jgi:hypothetical protein